MEWWQLYELKPEINKLIMETEKEVKKEHEAIDAISLFNQAKVLNAFQLKKFLMIIFIPVKVTETIGKRKLEALLHEF